jgi:putative zinc finger/helix-turn-helix YgiT family protein
MGDVEKFTMYCDECGADREFTRIRQNQTLKIRGEEITAEIWVVKCGTCGTVQPDPSPNADPMLEFYGEYRKKYALLTPEEIRSIRESYGMSAEAFSAVLGMSAATIYRYEGGALQDATHNSLLVLCKYSWNMKTLVDARKGQLTPLQLARFEQRTGQRLTDVRTFRPPIQHQQEGITDGQENYTFKKESPTRHRRSSSKRRLQMG